MAKRGTKVHSKNIKCNYNSLKSLISCNEKKITLCWKNKTTVGWYKPGQGYKSCGTITKKSRNGAVANFWLETSHNCPSSSVQAWTLNHQGMMTVQGTGFKNG